MSLLFFQISFLLGTLTSLVIATWLFENHNRSITSRNFIVVTILGAGWSFGFYQMISTANPEMVFFWRWFMDSAVILLPIYWLKFVFAFLEVTPRKIVLYSTYLVGFTIWSINFADIYIPGLFVKAMEAKLVFAMYPTAGIGYYLLFVYFAVLVLYSMALLIKPLGGMEGVRATQHKFMISAAVLGFGGSAMAFLPTFNILIPPVGVIFFSLYPLVIAYAIYKHHLFETKLIAINFIGVSIGLLLLLRFIVSETALERTINGTLFFVALTFGVTVIRAIMKDIQHRTVIEHLVSQLTIANNRLEMLEKQKSEFVSIASHQLRTPLTAIKGYASMLLEGSFGPIKEKTKEPIERIFKSSQKLVMIIENFLTISRIEQGRMIYRFESIDLKGVVDTIAEELHLSIEQKGLRLDINVRKGAVYMVKGDLIKLKQVVHNLISNAIKHTDSGFLQIEIAHSYEPGKVLLTLSDTGRGLTGPELKRVFDRRDIVAAEEGEMQDDTGVELFISREMIKAHGGRLWAESQGLGQGASFFMELPESVASGGWYE